MIDILICPISKKKLKLSSDGKFYHTEDGMINYPIKNGIIKFIQNNDDFYEGSYVASVKWVPKSEKWYHIWPLWLINNNYIWTVRKFIKEQSLVLEIGCGGGIKYFGNRYRIIGLDLSYSSLLVCPNNYLLKIQANALNIPLENGSVDAIISSCFWEHINLELKKSMLKEFYRVLKNDGIIIFMYDVVSDNFMIRLMREKNPNLFQKLFIDADNHQGYLTPQQNIELFDNSHFSLIKLIGIEKTIFQTASVYNKGIHFGGLFGKINKLIHKIITTNLLFHLYNAFIIIIDKTIGKLISIEKSRMIISIHKKVS